jgi:hypothetical protein
MATYRIAARPDPMSRSAMILVALAVILVGGFVGLVMMANSSQPPQRQVEQTIPDERLPK